MFSLLSWLFEEVETFRKELRLSVFFYIFLELSFCLEFTLSLCWCSKWFIKLLLLLANWLFGLTIITLLFPNCFTEDLSIVELDVAEYWLLGWITFKAFLFILSSLVSYVVILAVWSLYFYLSRLFELKLFKLAI